MNYKYRIGKMHFSSLVFLGTSHSSLPYFGKKTSSLLSFQFHPIRFNQRLFSQFERKGHPIGSKLGNSSKSIEFSLFPSPFSYKTLHFTSKLLKLKYMNNSLQVWSMSKINNMLTILEEVSSDILYNW